MTGLEMLVAAAEKFVAKVERGQARSKVTYAEMVAALEKIKAERLGG